MVDRGQNFIFIISLFCKMPRDERKRAFMFVIYNWTQDDILFCQHVQDQGLCSYIIVGEEICPRTQTPHLQVKHACHIIL